MITLSILSKEVLESRRNSFGLGLLSEAPQETYPWAISIPMTFDRSFDLEIQIWKYKIKMQNTFQFLYEVVLGSSVARDKQINII
jgi:hypothetical protein